MPSTSLAPQGRPPAAPEAIEDVEPDDPTLEMPRLFSPTLRRMLEQRDPAHYLAYRKFLDEFEDAMRGRRLRNEHPGVRDRRFFANWSRVEQIEWFRVHREDVARYLGAMPPIDIPTIERSIMDYYLLNPFDRCVAQICRNLVELIWGPGQWQAFKDRNHLHR